MDVLCNDNRFELINSFKDKLIEATNISKSPDEMAALDSILFRMWQMGWLDILNAQEQRVITQAKNGVLRKIAGFFKEWDGEEEGMTLPFGPAELREIIGWNQSAQFLNRKLDELRACIRPRILNLEEVKELRENDVVWLEDNGNPDVIPGIVRSRQVWPHSTALVTNFTRCDRCTVTAGDDDYMVRWRCWTSRPSEDQRRQTAWKT